MQNKIELLRSLLSQTEQLPHRDDNALDAIRQRSEMLIRRLFGHNSFYLTNLQGIRFHPIAGPVDQTHHNESWRSGHQSLINLISTMLEDIRQFESTPEPVLTINDDVLRSRTSDLLSAPGHFDRVLREATTILESRLRAKVPFDDLATLIPNAADQTGNTLIDKLCSPRAPIIVFGDRQQQTRLFQMLRGTIAYFRNPSHHSINDDVAWSWAWSVVSLVDQLLNDLETARYQRPSNL